MVLVGKRMFLYMLKHTNDCGSAEYELSFVLVWSVATKQRSLSVLLTTQMYLSQFWKLEVPDQAPAWSDSAESLLVVCRVLASYHSFMWLRAENALLLHLHGR